jgi:hypothetical protein
MNVPTFPRGERGSLAIDANGVKVGSSICPMRPRSSGRLTTGGVGVIGDEGRVVHREGEPTRALGISRLRTRLRSEEYQPRVLGIPRDWFGIVREAPGSRAFDVRRITHPVRWWRWRRQVHRLGPYAPDYDDDGGSASPEHEMGNAPRDGE